MINAINQWLVCLCFHNILAQCNTMFNGFELVFLIQMRTFPYLSIFATPENDSSALMNTKNMTIPFSPRSRGNWLCSHSISRRRNDNWFSCNYSGFAVLLPLCTVPCRSALLKAFPRFKEKFCFTSAAFSNIGNKASVLRNTNTTTPSSARSRSSRLRSHSIR